MKGCLTVFLWVGLAVGGLVALLLAAVAINTLAVATHPNATQPPAFTRYQSATEAEMLASPTPPPNAIQVVRYSWEKGGFGVVGIIHVTLKNTSQQALGNIKYQTRYYSETGQVRSSVGGERVLEKILKPGQTRSFEINDGFIDAAKSDRMSFEVSGYELMPNN